MRTQHGTGQAATPAQPPRLPCKGSRAAKETPLAFLTEPAPVYGTPQAIAPGLRRLTAPNASPLTYHGTNTWLLNSGNETTLIDPGPDDSAHLASILAAIEGRLARIVLTHTHPDHLAGARKLAQASGAPILGWGKPWQQDFSPDQALEHQEKIAGLTALHTPGHASDHLCFAWDQGGLFSGDHVMGWNTSIVSPPDGDMAAYMDSLRLLLARNDGPFYPGHGPVIPQPQSLMRAMLGHRLSRETAILAAIADGVTTQDAIVERLYADLDWRLKNAAERTVLAHLIKLRAEGRVPERPGGAVPAPPDPPSII